jgi:hypothetical protein
MKSAAIPPRQRGSVSYSSPSLQATVQKLFQKEKTRHDDEDCARAPRRVMHRDGAALLPQMYWASAIIPLAFANDVRNRVHDVRMDLILVSGRPTKMAAATYCDMTRPE